METPSFKEDHISQLPALKLLMGLGWQYLSPAQALELRANRTSNVLLEPILKKQLAAINTIHYKGKAFEFSEANINNALLSIRNLPVQDGFLAANKAYYELITLGRSFEQNVLGDKKSFSFQFIDWENPENNSYHVTEELSVSRSGRNEYYRPDIVLYINGIPMVVIECKSPRIKNPIEKAIEQHLRNQEDDGIRSLYQYSNLCLSLATNDARYGTTATNKEFWSVWKELFHKKEEQTLWEEELAQFKNADLSQEESAALFQERHYLSLRDYKNTSEAEQVVTPQDKLLGALCKTERLLDFIRNFTLFDEGIKKVARYQQYFAVKNTLKKIEVVQPSGLREGGVIWHTQGSGKSLTMAMLAQLIASNPNIKNPKILLVTDRIDLDSQITDTFKKCHVPVENAQTGKHLVELITGLGDRVITTLIHKFEAAVRQLNKPIESTEVFILVDEGHRSQYGSFNVHMQKVFPKACFIAFTGTPLMKREKNTANKFGGLIDVYSINDAVEDGAVVPLLYEGRHNLIEVNERPLDNYFEKVSEPLTDYGKAALKRKFSSKNQLNQAEEIIVARAWDISDHFVNHVQGITFGSLNAKAQLVAPNKTTAIRYRQVLNEIGKVHCEVLISPPDIRENHEDAFEESDDLVLNFWKAMMDKYGRPEKYEEMLIGSFKKQDYPEIIIVVDKLITGFDAPNNYVLYLTRQLKEHTLLQAIARVNRLAPGKTHGLIIDYYGNLENLDTALETYSGDQEYDKEDLEGTVTNIREEIKKLPEAHTNLWDIFKPVKNKYDEPAYEELLNDEALRHEFYQKVSYFSRLLKLALSSIEFTTQTPEKTMLRYKKDAKFFLELRVSVKRRYFDDVDYKEYEPQVRKLIDKHITSDGEIIQITDEVNIFNKEEREKEVEKIVGTAAKADHIASRTVRAINVKMEDDPVFYRKLSSLIKETIEDYHHQRISEAEYLSKAKDLEKQFHEGMQDKIPSSLQGKPIPMAFYNLIEAGEVLSTSNDKVHLDRVAISIDEVIQSVVIENGKPIIDWENKSDIEGEIRLKLDDYFFDLQEETGAKIELPALDDLINEVLKIAKRRYTHE